jgi:dipeptide transport system substrate-binding protein
VKWHSSKIFTPTRDFNADDVIFTITRMFDENHPYYKVGGSNYQLLRRDREAEPEGGREARRLHRSSITLTKPYAPLLSALSVEPMSILSAEYADAMMKAGTPEQVNQAPIGTGPFSLVVYQKDATIRFKAVPDHWTKAVGNRDRMALVNDLIFVITPDASVRYAKVKSGECQIARYPNPGDLPAMKADRTSSCSRAASPIRASWPSTSRRSPSATSACARRWSTRPTFPPSSTRSIRAPASRRSPLVPPSLWSHDDALKPRPYDPEKAKALLAEAGYPNGFKTVLWAIPVVRAYMPNGRRAAELIQADWAKIGVQAEIQSYEWGEYLKRGRAGDHEVGMFGYTWDYPDPSQILLSGWHCDGVKSGSNRARWCNKEASDALAKANTITDQARAHQDCSCASRRSSTRMSPACSSPMRRLSRRCARR